MTAKLKMSLGEKLLMCVYNNIHGFWVLSLFQMKQRKFALIRNTNFNTRFSFQSQFYCGLEALLSSVNHKFRTQFPPLEKLVSQYKYEKINM